MKNSKTVILKRGRGRLREVVKRFLERHRGKVAAKTATKKALQTAAGGRFCEGPTVRLV